MLKTIDTTAGAGDILKDGGDKLNWNVKQLQMRTGTPLSTVWPIFDGDSKGREIKVALTWLAFTEGLDITFGGPNSEPNIGGSNSSNTGANLTSPTRMADVTTRLNGYSSTGRVFDYYLTMGTNDTSSFIPPLTTMANIRKFHEQVLRPQSGFRYLMLVGVDPRASADANGAAQIHSINQLYARYAAENPFDVIYIDTMQVMLDPAAENTTGNPIPYNVTTSPMVLGAVTVDGLHGSEYGNYLKRISLLPIKHLYKRKTPRNLMRNLPQTASMSLYTPAETNHRTVALGGTVNLTNNGTGTVTGTGPDGWEANVVLNGTMSVAFTTSTVVITTDGGPIPRGTWPSVRMTVSGATGASGGGTSSIGIKQATYPAVGFDANENVVAGAILHLNALKNLLGIRRTSNNGGVQGADLGTIGVLASAPLAQVLADPITGPIWLEGSNLVTSGGVGGYFNELQFVFPPNVTLSGSIDILDIYTDRVPVIPAAAA